MSTIHAIEFLSAKSTIEASVCATFGDEPFLKQLAISRICDAVLEGDDDAPFTTFDGDTAKWRDVIDEVSTVSLFGGDKRLVVVDNADAFVTANRPQLEDYVERPSGGGVLVLSPAKWPSNTRLYKQVNKVGLQIECRPPEKTVGRSKVLDEGAMVKWLIARAKSPHRASLDKAAAKTLLELVGPKFGMLEQDLAKLALFADEGGKIDATMVTDIVGGWRTKSIWDLLDLAAAGEASEALAHLDRLFQAGEAPAALFGQMSWSLRRYAAATRMFQMAERSGRRVTVRAALEGAGVRDWPKGALAKAEKQLKQMGRERAGKMYRWLLEADLALKGSHSAPQPARFVLEHLILRLAKEAR